MKDSPRASQPSYDAMCDQVGRTVVMALGALADRFEKQGARREVVDAALIAGTMGVLTFLAYEACPVAAQREAMAEFKEALEHLMKGWAAPMDTARAGQA